MATISFETSGFSIPAPPKRGDLRVSLARLIWGAVTVGATPIALATPSRPYLELCWRAALAAANVRENRSSNQWVKTDAYKRLDPSEKSAVSYLLGMTQAKITCDMLLGVPHLVHLDAYLAMVGRSTRRSRPDLIGFDFATSTYGFAVEAKGRTHGWTRAVTDAAKAQAGLLPGLIGTPSTIAVASIAYFESDDTWHAYLEDPPSAYRVLEDLVSIPGLLVAYYRPLVATVLTEGVSIDERSSDRTFFVRLSAIDAWLGLPRAIVEILRPSLSGVLSVDRATSIGANIQGALTDLSGKQASANASKTWQQRGASETEDPSRCTGYDGVQVILGESWFGSQ